MTSKVVITASLAPEKEVEVVIKDGEEIVEQFAVQDGETEERYVYDDRVITVREVEK